ncbi:bifunctional 2-C-methyl-D-erythritol 4-phosphate cytidylyltransferase/2-C-methyl-D-erythritol 2,4-cyclodiphosphate synthase [Rhodospirillales bacterium]|nr:bifunctional 2-C-methyl-D-erythritol 4-phosphate cytidylyltransferase/2-C-methyl-D-erythritol 2,4-cyclodiphosphate synthase [Rhodospirillales bacterium]
MARIAVIIVAAGRGHRFGGEMPKQYLEVHQQPLVRHAVQAFLDHPAIDLILPVIHPDDADILANALGGLNYLEPVAGGAARQDSVRNGLEGLASSAPDYVLVHDAARAMVAPALIDRVIEALQDTSGVIPGIAVVDTLKRADDDGIITDTVSRDGLWRAQTPQGFKYADLLAAHRSAIGQELTDDAAVMEASGYRVAVVLGDENNIKVTTPDDLMRMEEIMSDDSAQAKPVRSPSFRIGSGYDVHKLGPGDHVTLCGVEITSERALIGHSDADVALHAVTDAVFGAIADGDIGSHFPPTDSQWRGASSDQFLAYACERMGERGFELSNIDLTIICEKPKIGPHRDAMRARLAEIAQIDVSCVSVKATTTERLGFTGRGEGIAAEAVIIIEILR